MTNRTISLRNFLLAILSLISLSVIAQGPKISVVEYTKDGTKINTFEIKTDPPQKPLVTNKNGRKSLNIDSDSLQEVGANNLLNSNFDFNYVCNYREWYDFTRDYPTKERWELEELFSKYIKDNKIKLKKNAECFAEELDRLIKAHPCLAKKGNIEFRIKPIENAMETYDHGNNDYRRIFAVRLTGCPTDEDNSLRACTYIRPPKEDGNFFGPPRWAEFVSECIAEFKKPEIKKMADAAVQTAHTR